MEIKLTRRVSGIAESATLAISAKAKKLKAEGRDVVNFGVGEPDFNTPDYIIEAAIKAMREGKTKYTPASGIPELKKAIVENRKLAVGAEYSPSQVVIGTGAKQPLYNAIAALAEEGDEVIVPSPYWVTYPELAGYCGAKSVFVETKPENGYKMTAEELEKAITPRTKLLILNSPNNPTGAVYSREELSAIAEVILKHDGIFVISDEIYRDLVYGGEKHVSIASLGEEIKARTIIIDGMSKSYAMTGWRIGWAIAPEKIAAAMTRAQSHITSNVNSVAQYASLEGLTNKEKSDEFIAEMRKTFDSRRLAAVKILENHGVKFIMPKGAFYIFVNVSGTYGKTTKGGIGIENSADFANALLNEKEVAVVPGSAFGADDYVRISYATDESALKKGIEKLCVFIEETAAKITEKTAGETAAKITAKNTEKTAGGEKK